VGIKEKRGRREERREGKRRELEKAKLELRTQISYQKSASMLASHA